MPESTIKEPRWALRFFAGLILTACGGSETALPEHTASHQASSPEANNSQASNPQATQSQAAASDEAQPSRMGEPAGSEQEVSETEVELFAEVQTNLLSMQQQVAERAQAGADEAELQQLQARMQEQAQQVIENSAMSAERFNEIAMQLEQDTVLRDRVYAAIKRIVGE